MVATATIVDNKSISDEEVIRRVLAGEQHLYEVIIRRYNARLYRVCMAIVGNDSMAEDAMQSAYIKAYEHLQGFNGTSAFGTWLTRILINESLQMIKKEKRTVHMNSESEYTAPGAAGPANPGSVLLNNELRRMLEQALQQLPDKYRIVFMLREVEQMSIAETVSTLSISEANVKVRLNRAKSMLRDSLSGYYQRGDVFQFHLSRCNRVVANVFAHLGIHRP